MFGTFYHSSNFDGNITDWDTSSVTNMQGLFYYSVFNKDISGWDVSSVTNMGYFVKDNTDFYQNLSSWRVSQIPTKPTYFDLSIGAYYEQTAIQPQWGY
jgi:surface protein